MAPLALWARMVNFSCSSAWAWGEFSFMINPFICYLYSYLFQGTSFNAPHQTHGPHQGHPRDVRGGKFSASTQSFNISYTNSGTTRWLPHRVGELYNTGHTHSITVLSYVSTHTHPQTFATSDLEYSYTYALKYMMQPSEESLKLSRIYSRY